MPPKEVFPKVKGTSRLLEKVGVPMYSIHFILLYTRLFLTEYVYIYMNIK